MFIYKHSKPYYNIGEYMYERVGEWAFILGVIIAIIAGLAAGFLDSIAYPMACAVPESGTPATTSTLILT